MNDAVWWLHFPSLILRSQLYAIGRHIKKGAMTDPTVQAPMKPITVQEATRNLLVKNIRL